MVTIFSAPNYCGEFSNLGAVLSVDEHLTCKLDQFEGQPVPITKRKRSVTPIKTTRPPGPAPGEVDSPNLKKRKATNIKMGFSPPCSASL